jgi:aspartate racemase
MGPDATVDLMRRVLALTPAQDDQDHIRLLVDNNPKVPSRIAALIEGTGPSPLPTLVAMAQGLERAGADFLAMPCNTAHHYHGQIAATVSIPFLNLMELVVAELAAHHGELRRIGLLASSALPKIRLYEPYFETAGLDLVYPRAGKQEALMALIRAVKAARADETTRRAFGEAARDIEEQGAEITLVACTELSFVESALSTALPVVDAADVLARAVVQRAMKA